MKSKRVRFTTVVGIALAFVATGIPLPMDGSVAFGEAKSGEVRQQTPLPKAATPQIPASGKQGPPGKAATLIGNRKQGETLFTANCQSCHGPKGTDKVPNPGSDDGTVPPLNPLDPKLVNKNPSVFAANIDRIIQHGSRPDGPNPVLSMPNWGDGKTLSQQKIADLEAYIMYLNGIERR